FGHVAAVFAEGVADFADGAVAIVGIDVEQDSDSAGPVAFQGKFFVVDARQFASATLNGTLDVVGGHVFAFGREDGGAQPRIAVGIAAAIFSRNADFLDKTGKNLAPLGVERAFFMFNCCPLRMPGHGNTSSL